MSNMKTRLASRGLIVAAMTAFAMVASPAVAKDKNSMVKFTPLNDSGVSGNARLKLSDDRKTLTVKINARGLEKGGIHVAHIHGRVNENGNAQNSTSPTIAQDSDGDGFVEVGEGQATYGPIIVQLGNIDPDGDGKVNYSMTFDLTNPATYSNGYDRMTLLGDDLMSIDLREIVIHGRTVLPGPGEGTDGEVDGTNGYLVVLPVASGEIQ